MTTIHRKQVFLGPEQHRLNARLMTGSQQHFGGEAASSELYTWCLVLLVAKQSLPIMLVQDR